MLRSSPVYITIAGTLFVGGVTTVFPAARKAFLRCPGASCGGAEASCGGAERIRWGYRTHPNRLQCRELRNMSK